ncbi:hypothetical protein CO111_00050, partial [Candidatus Desantisbacteria bacterium CG_4_9_14_3_um_filter_50_7]
LPEKKQFMFAFIPMLFMFITTISALFLTSRDLLKKFINITGVQAKAGNLISALIGMFLIVAAVLLFADGLKVFFKPKKKVEA